jgi:hypothetical protein
MLYLYSTFLLIQYIGNCLSFVVFLPQFAMGINMLAKMIVFTSVKKWDGDTNWYIRSEEYTQVNLSYIK